MSNLSLLIEGDITLTEARNFFPEVHGKNDPMSVLLGGGRLVVLEG